MKKVLVAGLFPDRNRTFFGTLCAQFPVVAFRELGIEPGASCPFEVAEEIVGETREPALADLAWELDRAARFTEQRLGSLLGRPVWLTREEHALLVEQTMAGYERVEVVEELLGTGDIGLVVTSADYDGHRRPIVLEARRQGIPTICIEHGLALTMRPTRRTLKEDHGVALLYASDYVNFDNEMELQAATENHECLPPGQRPEFLCLGTPIDEPAGPAPSREAARGSLGLGAASTVVTFLGAWLEGRSPSSVFKDQLELAEIYPALLRSMPTSGQAGSLELVIKMHPAFGPAYHGLLDEARCFAEDLVGERGLDNVRLVDAPFEEILAASDILVSPRFTSAFWNAFLAEKPSVLVPSASLLQEMRSPEDLLRCSPLASSGCLRVAFEPAGVWPIVDELIDAAGAARFRESAREVKRSYRIEAESVEAKSERICGWIRELLGRS